LQVQFLVRACVGADQSRRLKTPQVKITVTKALREVDGIYGGYILFTPTSSTASTSRFVTKTLSRKASRAAFKAALEESGAVPLSVPYQGSSKDYSTVGEDDSLVLFVPALHDLNPTSAEALDSKPSLFLCDVDGAGKCGYTPKLLKAPVSTYKNFRFASTLLRPVADVRVQVGAADQAVVERNLPNTLQDQQLLYQRNTCLLLRLPTHPCSKPLVRKRLCHGCCVSCHVHAGVVV
jgi:hypothetical protein